MSEERRMSRLPVAIPLYPVPLYQRVLGPDFDRLPVMVRALHDVREKSTWTGRADVERGTSILCRVLAVLAGLPPTGEDQPLTVTFTPDNGAEVWHRAFGTTVFRTRQSAGGQSPGNTSVILETAGPPLLDLVRLHLKPYASADGLSLDLIAMRIIGIPVPRFLVPSVVTREYELDGRYRFEVEAEIKAWGRLVHYSGWLVPAPRTAL